METISLTSWAAFHFRRPGARRRGWRGPGSGYTGGVRSQWTERSLLADVSFTQIFLRPRRGDCRRPGAGYAGAAEAARGSGGDAAGPSHGHWQCRETVQVFRPSLEGLPG